MLTRDEMPGRRNSSMVERWDLYFRNPRSKRGQLLQLLFFFRRFYRGLNGGDENVYAI